MNIGDRVKEQRNKLGLSAQKLANAIDVSVDMIRSIEINRAKPSVETLAKLSIFFGCTADYLLGNSNEPTYSSRKDLTEILKTISKMSLEEKNSILKALIGTEFKSNNKGDQ